MGLVRYAPASSAVVRVTHGEQVAWSPAEHLLANLVDLTQYLVWFKTADGQKGRNRPQPVRRPGAEAPTDGASLGSQGVATDLDDFNRKYAALAAAQAQRKSETG